MGSHRTLWLAGMAVVVCFATDAWCAGEKSVTHKELAVMSLQELLDIDVVTASRTHQTIATTTAYVSIVPRDEIVARSCASLVEAIRLLPGVTVGWGQFGEHTIVVRGIYTESSEKVVVQIDGHTINDVRFGSATYQFLTDFPLDNVERIEFVRGPASSLYGANAVLGVINVITRGGAAGMAVETSATTEQESDATVGQRYNVFVSGGHGAWTHVLNVNLADLDGATLPVETDAFGRSGFANLRDRRVDLSGSTKSSWLDLRWRYLDRDAGDGYGLISVLNDGSRQQVRYGYLDATATAKVHERQELRINAYVDAQSSDNYYELFPPGTAPSGSGYEYWNPGSLIGNPLAKELVAGAEASHHLYGDKHTLVTGVGVRYERLYDPRLISNSNPNPLPEVRDVTDTYNWIMPSDRTIAAVFVEDAWRPAHRVRTTVGVRADNYSDFGNTVNPRVGVSADLTDRITARASAGTAFRAPDFASMYVMNNPLTIGNPDLEPETIWTLEGGLGGAVLEDLYLHVNGFYSELDDLFSLSFGDSNLVINRGRAVSKGVEVEARWYVRRSLLAASYTWTIATLNDHVYHASPRFSVSAYFHTLLAYRFALAIDGTWQSETYRVPGDARPPVPDYALVSGSLRWTDERDRIAAWVAVHNIFDEDYAFPSSFETLPVDFPGPPRSFVLGMSVRLDRTDNP